ncbi:oligosaccharide flippase family protein [Jeotgalibacillus proteolyticus]|uniref:oligosaccharide flippase family protein n=1 Tax=Jeotgalibacillus proteolyticus TaxID=2082395 RepID=UPI003CF7CC79
MKKNSIHYIISSLISGVAGFLIISILTKEFDPISYGDYSLVITTVALLNTVLISWITQSLIRMYNNQKDKSELNILLNTSLISLFCMWMFFLIIIITMNLIIETQRFIIPIIILFVGESLFLYSSSLFRALNKAKIYNIIVCSSWILKLVFIVSFIKFNIDDILIITIALAVPNILIGLIVVTILLFESKESKWFSSSAFKEIYRYGIPLVGLSSMQWIMSSSDRYILKLFNKDVELGVYSLAYSISSNIYNVFITFLLLISYPIILRSYEEGKSSLNATRSIKEQFNYFLLILLPITFGLSILSDEAILIISSPSYSSGTVILILTNLSMLIFGTLFYINKVWELTKNTREIFLNSIFAALINVLLTFILVPFFGGTGAAISTLLGYFFFLIISYVRSRKIIRLEIDYFTSMKIIICSLAMGIIVFVGKSFIENNLFHVMLLIAVGCLVYIILLKIFGLFNLITEFIKK